MRGRRGFSLVELLMALTIGMVVIVAGTEFAVRTFKARRGWTVRETVDRNARFAGLSLRRDAALAGVALESGATFASVGTGGDTLSLLRVPWMKWPARTDSAEAPVYPLHDDGGSGPTYPPGGNCGVTCLEFDRLGQPIFIAPGDLIHLRIGTVRRLLLVAGVTAEDPTFRVTFLNVPALAGRPSGLGEVPLLRSGTSMQQVSAVLYWRETGANRLLRATRFSETGQPLGEAVATDVTAFTARVLFVNGTEAANYNGLDADTANDGDDIIGVRVRAQIRATRADPAVNGGVRVGRWYEWRMSPRNLLYEKNRQ